ncbi:choice-of-anchor J domain-containing protein [Flavobacterium sp.]|mgnify:FL=1|uniref:choice-of-anchor J domain-containing protein n=1 Tax=Flavobacterium sp. TaxID=239 RepID=UPI002FDD6459
MKNNLLKSIFLLATTSVVLTSCVQDDDFAIPTINIPIFSDSFETSWDDWTKVNVTGAQEWRLDTQFGNPGNCAVMSGFAGGNNVNEDWLISPEIDLTNVSGAKLTFQTASRFAGNLLQIKISSDYTTGNPNAATWTNLSATLDTNTASYVWTNSGNIDISSFAGENVRIAFVYTSTSTASTTWEVDNILILKN